MIKHMVTIRSEYSFDQFETVLQKLAHEIAVEAITNLNQGRIRIQTSSSNRFERLETDKYTFSFYSVHIGFSRQDDRRDHWGFDIENKEYITSNHRTKLSFFVQVDGEYKDGKYVEKGRPEKEHKRAEEIRKFVQDLMDKNGIKIEPRFQLKDRR